MSRLELFAVALLALTATPFAVAQFSEKVPPAIPSVEGWERIAGELEFEDPRVALQYEFYVNPARPATYEVVRYRITDLDRARKDGPRDAATERLQWDRDGRDLRRFVCAQRGAGCSWREMEKGSAEYLSEVAVLLWLYDAHTTSMR